MHATRRQPSGAMTGSLSRDQRNREVVLSRGHAPSATGSERQFVMDLSPTMNLREFRCASCGYGISVSGALPICPMCQTTDWIHGDTNR
jgi:rubrerythrin